VAGAEIAETAADLAGVVETGIGVSFDLIRSSFCVPEVNFLRERFLFPEFVKKKYTKNRENDMIIALPIVVSQKKKKCL
jgi:hypothetical protein